jgi:threonine synthase
MMSRVTHLECSRCSKTHSADELHGRCDCGGALLARYALHDLSLGELRARPRSPWRYSELLPLKEDPVSFGEHATPLLSCPRLSERWDEEVWLKDDSFLPGGTFKARGAGVGLSRALELGVEKLVMPSAGNAGGAWSLYAARAGVDITVIMARSAPAANQAEVTLAGGELVLVDGSIADAGRVAAQIAHETGAFLATTFSEPYRLEGKKTAWLEVFDDLGDERSMALPRTVVLPVGGGVAAFALAKAAEEVRALGWSRDEPPAIVGVQASNCAPIVRAFERGEDDVARWGADPHTIAAGMRVPAPSEGALVLDCVRRSGGSMLAVSEDAIVRGVGDLAATEGVFACPEGASAFAAAEVLARSGRLEGPVVIYNTGSGIKYADALAAATGADALA